MLLLGSMGTLPTLWSDMLFPALTSIQQDLGTSAIAVQQTVSLFFVANAFMCLWHGVLSDAWGRRKPLEAHFAHSTNETALSSSRIRGTLARRGYLRD